MTSITRAEPQIWAIVARQHGVVSGPQMRAAGLTHSAIRHRVRTGRLWRVHRGVFAVGRAGLTREGRWLAAVLACGDGAALSHHSAAALWGIHERSPSRNTQISVPIHGGRRGPKGIQLHCTATLQPDDITERSAIPVTTLPRTLTDLAAVLDDKQLKSAVRQSERIHRLDLAQLRVSLDDHPHRRGYAQLRRLLDAYVPESGTTDSELEAAFLELCANHGLPMPETQVPIGPYRVDFLWRDLNLVVETDGRDAHHGFIAFRDDRFRDRALKAAGLEVLRFTGAEVLRGPKTVKRELAAAIERRTTYRPTTSD